MKQHKDGDPDFEILGASKAEIRPPAETRSTGLVANHDFSGIDSSWLGRRRGRALGRALEEYAGGLQIAKRYADAAAGFERSHQELQLARARRGLLPLMVEQEQLRLNTEIEKSRGAVQAAIDLNGDLRARRLERRELEAEVHELEMLRKRRLIIEEHLAIKRLQGQLPENDAPAGGHDGDPLGDYLKTEAEVRRARSAAAREADTIRNAAAAEGRNITPEEADRIDQYEGAAAAAEEQIRRGGAADF